LSASFSINPELYMSYSSQLYLLIGAKYIS
jgi:hypothetical protein